MLQLENGRILHETEYRKLLLMQYIVAGCIGAGYADAAYIYARMAARFYYRECMAPALYDAYRGAYTPNRPTMWQVTTRHNLRFSK